MTDNTTPRRRHVEARLLERLAVWPAVLLLGPRQSGKTTLARGALESQGFRYIDFEAEGERDSATRDPRGFVDSLPDHAILDEIQHVPRIVLPLKQRIDGDRARANLLLTGSCQLIRLLPDSLAGRAEHLHLFPMSSCERAGVMPRFIDDLFDANFDRGEYPRLGADLRARIALGGYPAILPSMPAGIRQGWHRSYVSGLTRRDMQELYRVDRPEVLRGLLRAMASQTARLLNANRLATAFKVTQPTVGRYVRLMEEMFLLDIIPAWRNNRLGRFVKAPKAHFGDTGLACSLLGLNEETLATRHDLLGQLAETFVYQELRRQASGRSTDLEFHHYRENDKAEVDIVIESDGLRVAGVEVKAGATVTQSDFRGLQRLADAAGPNFACGVVLYDGEVCLPFGKRLRAVPIRRLWEPARDK